MNMTKAGYNWTPAKDNIQKNTFAILTCASFARTGLVRHGFSTRTGGISGRAFTSLNLGTHTADSKENIRVNYVRFCNGIGVDMDRLVLSHQVHSDNVRVVTAADAGRGLARMPELTDVDGLITAERGLPIATFYADCTPILLLDPVKRVIASVHSGWKGTLSRIGRKAVQKMELEFGCRAENILAATGPSIKQCHFEVSEDVYSLFVSEFGETATACTIEKNGKYYIDTDAINISELTAEGLLPEHISICPECTYCRNDLFFSHRADGGKTGRMCAAIELI